MAISAASFPLDAKYFSGLKNITPASLRVDSEGLVNILNFLQNDLANGNSVVHAMAVFGDWAIDGDGAETNGAGLVGADVLLTEGVDTFSKIEDDGVFADLAAAAAEAGYTANYQHFPDTPVADTDYLYLGAAVPFCEFAFGYATPAVYDSTDVVEWFYWDGSAWSALTVVHDGSNATITDGSEYGERDGATSFIPPSDWAAAVVDGQSAFWVRAGIATGKAANMTTVPISSENHQLVSPEDAWVAPCDGTVVQLRASSGAATLPGAADVKFILMNYTTGLHSAELTWDQAKRTGAWVLATALAVTDGDRLGVLVTQEDGTNEHSNVMFELEVAAVDA